MPKTVLCSNLNSQTMVYTDLAAVGEKGVIEDHQVSFTIHLIGMATASDSHHLMPCTSHMEYIPD